MTEGENLSLKRRILQIACAITWCLLAAGPVFGFAAFKPILIREGVYNDKCHEAPSTSAVLQLAKLTSSFLIARDQGSEHMCEAQDLSLNLIFTLAAVITNVSALVVGTVLDVWGPRVTGLLGSFFLALGALAFKYSKYIYNESPLDPYLSGYILLALGGPFVFISCFQLANSFPKNSGLILALLTGAFDASSALFLFYRIGYTKWHPVSLDKFFTVYLLVPLFIAICEVTIMPKKSYKTVGTLAKIGETQIDETGRPIDRDLLLPEDREDNTANANHPQYTITETTSLIMRRASFSRRDSTTSRLSYSSRMSSKSIYEQDAEDRLINSSGGVFGILHDFDVIDQLKSKWFLLMTAFTTIQMLRINYFVATIKSQELYLYKDEEVAATINHFFDIALPVGGILSIPFIGLLLDNLRTNIVLTILSVVSVVIGIMGVLTWLPATYAGIILLVLYRPFYYTSVSDYCAKVFGFQTFGTIYGTLISISGICNILQSTLDKVTHEVFKLNPIPVNLILTGLTILFAVLLISFINSQIYNVRRKNLEIEAQEAPLRTGH
ncbi:Piso0_002693 [Millerozyma farinosa CBS 7064]|uniref:Piso0_002693 protein n=1 Tax=Pichia sorbitophila (strain ATCC MYA-4447 / BCRC 22081 / CBS 7064 / NBRC 10061 / NRRL Y-12695) TaxID=559304 RepID=G8YFQ5_PICSO|nr:Piso0_002693 [Millerozyma farinosa CBS 7064]